MEWILTSYFKKNVKSGEEPWLMNLFAQVQEIVELTPFAPSMMNKETSFLPTDVRAALFLDTTCFSFPLANYMTIVIIMNLRQVGYQDRIATKHSIKIY